MPKAFWLSHLSHSTLQFLQLSPLLDCGRPEGPQGLLNIWELTIPLKPGTVIDCRSKHLEG